MTSPKRFASATTIAEKEQSKEGQGTAAMSPGAADANVRATTDRIDEIVAGAFDRTQPDVTVVAVGGYGRRELFPYSDVDLLLLTEGPPNPAQRERVSEFLRLLWDSGLRVSQSVHTPVECCEIHDGNLELTISLLDQRYLCGDASRYAQLQQLFPKFIPRRGMASSHTWRP